MFTGIIERAARVIATTPGPGFTRLIISADGVPDAALGESIAINGVCLTVAELSGGELHFDVIAETLEKTNLGLLRRGDHVHLERAMRIGDRLSGHFVQGHVDGVAVLASQQHDERETRLRLKPADGLIQYVSPKGSVTLDGVSLTVAALHDGEFEVALIPTTTQITQLTKHDVGYPFNFEADIINKTVVAHLARGGNAGDSSIAGAVRAALSASV